MNRKALFVGINHYPQSPLGGCVNDAKYMSEILSRNEDNRLNFHTNVMVSGTKELGMINRSKVRKALKELLKDDVDIALFYFSGHGHRNEFGGYLVTEDAQNYDEGVSMDELLSLANSSQAKEVIIILDCCYSGIAGSSHIIDEKKTILREGVCILTASGADQYSKEKDGIGVFTRYLINGLKGGAANLIGEITIPGLFEYAARLFTSWTQRPVLKSNLTRSTPIRLAKPLISREEIQRMPEIFEQEGSKTFLNPSFEPTSDTPDPTNVRTMQTLQTLRSAGLVAPTMHEHLYEVAMKSGSCELTLAGQYYWELAKNELI